MAFLLDDAAFGGQLMVGAGQPVAIGVGPGRDETITVRDLII